MSLATRWTKHKNKFTDEARTSVCGRVVTVSAAPGQYRVSLASRWAGRKDKFTAEVRTGVHERVVTVSASGS